MIITLKNANPFPNLLNLISINNWTHYLVHGYPAHFIIGTLIGGLICYLIHKNTINNLKAWIISLAFVSAIGLAKEIIDPYMGRQRDKIDLIITILGGIIGAGIVVLFKKNKTK